MATTAAVVLSEPTATAATATAAAKAITEARAKVTIVPSVETTAPAYNQSLLLPL